MISIIRGISLTHDSYYSNAEGMRENTNRRTACSPADDDVQMAPVSLYLAENNEKYHFSHLGKRTRPRQTGRGNERASLILLVLKHPIHSDPRSIKRKSKRIKRDPFN